MDHWLVYSPVEKLIVEVDEVGESRGVDTFGTDSAQARHQTGHCWLV